MGSRSRTKNCGRRRLNLRSCGEKLSQPSKRRCSQTPGCDLVFSSCSKVDHPVTMTYSPSLPTRSSVELRGCDATSPCLTAGLVERDQSFPQMTNPEIHNGQE